MSSAPDQRAAKTALIVEENLGRTIGHYDAWIDGIVGALRSKELKVTILGARQAVRLPGGAPIEPWFSKVYFDAYLSAKPGMPARLLSALTHNAYLFRRLVAWLRRHPRYDLVMATQVNVFHLLGWRLTWMLFGQWKIRRLVLLSTAPMWLCEYDDVGDVRPHKGAGFVGLLYRLFRGAVRRGEILLAAETEHDARQIEAVSGVPVVTLPTPRPESLIAAARWRIAERRAARPRPPVLGWLGRCSEEKGFSHFFAACRQFLATHPETPCTVLIQYLVGPEGCRVAESDVDRLAAADHRVRLIKESATGDAYGSLLGELDCLVLPYLRRNYVGRNSSAALDAVLAGIPIITTEGTWMAELMAKHGAGLGCPDQDAPGLASVMLHYVAQSDALGRAAWESSEGARTAISWSRFVDVVLR